MLPGPPIAEQVNVWFRPLSLLTSRGDACTPPSGETAEDNAIDSSSYEFKLSCILISVAISVAFPASDVATH